MPRKSGDYVVRDVADVRRLTIRIINDVRRGELSARAAQAAAPLLRIVLDTFRLEPGKEKDKAVEQRKQEILERLSQKMEQAALERPAARG